MTPMRISNASDVIRLAHILNAERGIAVGNRHRPFLNLIAEEDAGLTPIRKEPVVVREELLAQLRRQGFVLNDERRAVINTLAEADQPMDAEQIWDHARGADGRVSRSTTHRVLRILAEIDVVEVAARRRGRRMFRLRRDRPSVHLVRADTGAMDEMADVELMDALMAAVMRRGYRLSGGVELRVMPLSRTPPAA